METIGNVLVALGDDADEAKYVLEKARVVAAAAGAKVHVVRVVHEGVADLSASAIEAATDLKTFILASEETVTEDMVEPLRRLTPDVETATLWNARPWEGVLHAAELVRADLVIKAASLHHRFGEIIRTPDDWNLLRGATVPVMLVKPQAWIPSPAVLCALDAFDESHDELNRTLLRHAAVLAKVLHGDLHVVVAYPLFERWVGELGGLRDYDQIRQEVETEIRDRVVKLADQAGVEYTHLYADEGPAEHVIGTLADNLRAEVVVVGTHARQGLKGVLLGNTSERLVHHLTTDVLTVHAPGT